MMETPMAVNSAHGQGKSESENAPPHTDTPLNNHGIKTSVKTLTLSAPRRVHHRARYWRQFEPCSGGHFLRPGLTAQTARVFGVLPPFWPMPAVREKAPAKARDARVHAAA